jgi:hypothetical protein
MNFKKPKQEVIEETTFRVNGILSAYFQQMQYGNPSYPSHMHSYSGSYPTYGPAPILDTLQYTISLAIREAVISLVENTYTDMEFEEDLNLRDKS